MPSSSSPGPSSPENSIASRSSSRNVSSGLCAVSGMIFLLAPGEGMYGCAASLCRCPGKYLSLNSSIFFCVSSISPPMPELHSLTDDVEPPFDGADSLCDVLVAHLHVLNKLLKLFEGITKPISRLGYAGLALLKPVQHLLRLSVHVVPPMPEFTRTPRQPSR